ncbi:MAG: hypothetical protein ACREA9_28640, partial [Pyrinomonadaceae bacterium]
GHSYTIDGAAVPNVTRIIAPLIDFNGIPRDRLERKRQLGASLHKAIEYDVRAGVDLSTVPEPVIPYFLAWQVFIKHTEFQALLCEHPVASKIFGFAGTLDLVGKFKSNELAMLDPKTTFLMHPAVGVQLAGYAIAGNEMGLFPKNIKRYGLQLKADGSYNLVPYRDVLDFNMFMSLLNVEKFKEKHQCQIL